MVNFVKPEFEVVHFAGDVITASNECNCDFGYGPIGDDDYCTNIGVGGDLECIQTPEQGNC